MELRKLSSWRESGNFTCNHAGCDRGADFIVGSSHRDYNHFCNEHIEMYDIEGMEIIPNIRVIRRNEGK